MHINSFSLLFSLFLIATRLFAQWTADPNLNLAMPHGSGGQELRGSVTPTISAIARNVRVPNAGDTVVVTARIVDTTGVGISTDSLWYRLNGGSAFKLAMPRICGTNINGIYRGVIPGSANVNGNRVEYQISATGGGGTITTPISAANSYFAGISPMSPTGVKAQDSLRASLYKGYYVRVTGTINGPNFQAANLSQFFQDGYGGLNLFKLGAVASVRNLGDSVIVLGKLDQFHGVTQIVPDTASVDIQSVATGRSIPIISTTIPGYKQLAETYESRLIQLVGCTRGYGTAPWPPAATEPTITLLYRDPEWGWVDTVAMFISATTNIPGSSEPAYPWNVTCIGSQSAVSEGASQGGYRVMPRYRSDFPDYGWTPQTSGTHNLLNSVKAVSQNVAWAAGASGTVLRTVDHGVTWSSVGGGAIGTADIYNIDALDAYTAFVTTTPSATFIYRTTNAGGLWTQVFTDAGTTDAVKGAFINAIHMIDANNGIAVGDPVGGKWEIIKTTNGGASWARIAAEPAQLGGEMGTPNGLCVGLSPYYSNYIWFTSTAGGRIYRSTNAGVSWLTGIAPAGVTATSNVWFNSQSTGIATSSVSNAVFTSNDGGVTWTSVPVVGTGPLIACGGAAIYDFWYARGTTIYYLNHWQTYVGTGPFVALNFVGQWSGISGWAVTDGRGIAGFYGPATPLTSIEENHNGVLSTAYALQQNYPNPFNPTTTIRYSLPQAARVTLTIYNVLGQRVAELANEVESPGFYTSVWDGRSASGSQVATGVYFYRLEATPVSEGTPFTSLKKMLLVK